VEATPRGLTREQVAEWLEANGLGPLPAWQRVVLETILRPDFEMPTPLEMDLRMRRNGKQVYTNAVIKAHEMMGYRVEKVPCGWIFHPPRGT
jgi:hypothetical protein